MTPIMANPTSQYCTCIVNIATSTEQQQPHLPKLKRPEKVTLNDPGCGHNSEQRRHGRGHDGKDAAFQQQAGVNEEQKRHRVFGESEAKAFESRSERV